MTNNLIGVLLLVCMLVFSQKGVAQTSNNAAVPLASGYGPLTYSLSATGSYKLPSLGLAPNGVVVDEQGNDLALHDLYLGKYTLLGFIYSNCKDINGCPLTSHVFYKVKSEMKDDAELADRLQLVSLSFDPENDSPEVMRLYGENFKYAGDKGEWRFLTTSSLTALQPTLDAYNQDVQRELSVNGDQSEDISHILRVFLVDPKLMIRNIYSLGFLHSDLILNDIKTLIRNDQRSRGVQGSDDASSKPLLSVPGDGKEGYETGDYITRSKAITSRRGVKMDLLNLAKIPPLGLPQIIEPESNPLTAEKIDLGRRLFFDRRLSLNDTFSCAMCHIPEQGFTSNELSMAVGIEGRSVRRNSPTLYNVAYANRLFHDGREHNLEQQVWGPLLAKNEMANPSVGYVVKKIRGIPDYQGLFENAFGGEVANMRTIGQALASYQRTLVSADSAFDKWYFDQQENALSESAKRGFTLFSGKSKCVACHSINEEHALFTDNQMHNTGVGYLESMGRKQETERIILAPGVFIEVDTEIIDSVGEETPADTGLYEITQNPNDRWKYKTPSLRNVSLTAPYMHNGALSSLEDVIRFYNEGGVKNKLRDAIIRPLNLSKQEQNDLLAFLNSLTGSNVDSLVSDAFSAPIGDLTHQDPNWAHEILDADE